MVHSFPFHGRHVNLVILRVRPDEFDIHSLIAISYVDKQVSGAGLKTDGIVLAVQLRFCDFRARQARFVERLPDSILDDAIAKLAAVIGVDE